jgi:hypothetical protein
MQHTTLKRLWVKRLGFALVASSFAALVVLATAQPASARQGEDDVTAQTTTQTQEPERHTDQQTESSPEHAAESLTEDNRREQVKTRVSELRENAKKELEHKKQDRTEKTAEKRKLVCENRQNAIQNKLAAYNQAADKHLTKLDGVYTKIKAYKAAENLQPNGWSDLVAAADTKQAAATAAVAALKQVATGVDCNDPETVVKLSAVREAAKSTRSALHEYRMALKTMVVALAQARDAAENTTSTGSGAATSDDPASNTTTSGGSQR